MYRDKRITDKSVQIKFVSFDGLCKNRLWLRIDELRIMNQIRHESPGYILCVICPHLCIVYSRHKDAPKSIKELKKKIENAIREIDTTMRQMVFDDIRKFAEKDFFVSGK